MTCNNCSWFVEEVDVGNYSHDDAVKYQKGFCLIKDLFTEVNPNDETCIEFNFDGVKNE